MSQEKTLIIVESPGKIKKISEILGNNYIVKASFGHIQDLDKKTLSIDITNNFAPMYVTSHDKLKVVKELKDLAKDCTEVIIASDEDREGEMIAHSLATVLKLKNPKRIVFHEITKNAILGAIKVPKTINYDMVHAQQTRRLLDRLVGYMISPVLWKYLPGNEGQSAGRVQSVVVRIINDKENEIIKSISEPYFKTTVEFKLEDNSKLSGTLQHLNSMYRFVTKEKANDFLLTVNKKTEFKVISVDNKKSTRKPSAPFITSSLQQEASTKLHYNVKRTMDIAQKLYEGGHITYMRTDSPNISKDCMIEISKFIIERYGQEYSDMKNYSSKNAGAQEAHECIRPTHIENEILDCVDANAAKLYSLIWKRTIASQMSNATINIQTIQLDGLNKDKKLPYSILKFENTQTYFNSVLENVIFPGYLTVYDNTPINESEEEKIQGKLEIKVNNILNLQKIKVSEEYTKPPLRYNEAALVKYLEKRGIGRPSTYASIISKIIERQYVEITNIEGVKKQSVCLELESKQFKIKEIIKDISIGKEINKLVPTDCGKKVNDFMMTHFIPIMDVEFTSNFEGYLDKIAEGNANWVTVLKTFYDMFNPIVEKLNSAAKAKQLETGSSTDKLLGNNNGLDVYCGTGKYGPYVKMQTDSGEKKWVFGPLKEITLEDVTMEDALEILSYPKTLGKIGNAIITLNKGQYGLYLKYNGKNYSVKSDIPIENINFDFAKEMINNGDIYAIKTFKIKNKIVHVKKGEFGHYIQIVNGIKKQNISIPKNINVETITIENILRLISDKNGTSLKKN